MYIKSAYACIDYSIVQYLIEQADQKSPGIFELKFSQEYTIQTMHYFSTMGNEDTLSFLKM